MPCRLAHIFQGLMIKKLDEGQEFDLLAEELAG